MRMGWVPPGAGGEDGHWSVQFSAASPAFPLSLSKRSLEVPLTVGEVGSLGPGYRDCDGGLHTTAGPANILACVSW